MVPLAREVQYRMYYTLGKDCRIFRNVAIRDPRHNLDHYMVLECLHSYPLREHTEYLGRRMQPPLRPPTTPAREEGLFAALRRSIPKPKAREDRKNAWILVGPWRIDDERVSLQRGPEIDHTLIRCLGCAINERIKGDR